MENIVIDNNELFVKLRIIVQYHTKPGQSVNLVGSLLELGDWDINSSIEMVWSEDDYWTFDWLINFEPGQAMEDFEFEYKFLLNNTGSFIWEEGHNHRVNFSLPVKPVFVHLNEGWNQGTGSSYTLLETKDFETDVAHIEFILCLRDVGYEDHNVYLFREDCQETIEMNPNLNQILDEKISYWTCKDIQLKKKDNIVLYKYYITSKKNDGKLWESKIRVLCLENPIFSVTFDTFQYIPSDLILSWLRTGYVGMENTFAACSINSVLQALYFNQDVKTAILNFEPTKNENQDNLRGVTFCLKQIFEKLEQDFLPPNAKELIAILGLSDDVQEFNRLLCHYLDQELSILNKNTIVKDSYGGLFQYEIKCKNVAVESVRTEEFYDISLEVQGFENLMESLNNFMGTVYLENDSKYKTENFGFQDAEQNAYIKKLPKFLYLHLKRVEYDFTEGQELKILSPFSFDSYLDLKNFVLPEVSEDSYFSLKGVFTHSGDATSIGHYFIFLKFANSWYKFDDSNVYQVPENEATEDNFGKNDNSDDNFQHAYMLIYEKTERPFYKRKD